MSPPPPGVDLAADSVFAPSLPGRRGNGRPRLPSSAFWRKLAAFSGPGYLVAVGYMDPGNWATGLAAGSAFGYRLLWVIVAANLIAMTLQGLAAKLGIASGRDLAQACRDRYSPPVRAALWILCELAIIACDVAEVIGAAIALHLLFGLPLVAGIVLSTLGVFVVLGLERGGARALEAFIIGLIVVIGGCFVAEIAFAQPSLSGVIGGLAPNADLFASPAMLYLAVGVLGATVMPHNLYLHSSLVKARPFERSVSGRREALRFARIDTRIALSIALLINGAILVLAAAVFHQPAKPVEVGIQDAYHLLTPLLGAGAASALFGVALLASGQNSIVTGALAGQIVMEGFTDLRVAPWARRLISRLLAVAPAALIAGLYGLEGTAKLLIFSQVVLSLQLPFAVIPLIRLTSDRAKMGDLANTRLEALGYWTIAAALVAINLAMLGSLVAETF